MLFEGRSHYYHCPTCGRRTLVRWRDLDVQPSSDPWPYRGPDSPFPDELAARFGPVDERSFAFDFYCGGCGGPVRLLFWIEERRGMGGPWYPEVLWVLDLPRGSCR